MYPICKQIQRQKETVKTGHLDISRLDFTTCMVIWGPFFFLPPYITLIDRYYFICTELSIKECMKSF